MLVAISETMHARVHLLELKKMSLRKERIFMLSKHQTCKYVQANSKAPTIIYVYTGHSCNRNSYSGHIVYIFFVSVLVQKKINLQI